MLFGLHSTYREIQMERLFRVFMHTTGHELVRELIVTAKDEDEAAARAYEHVKAANQGKGERTKEESENESDILAIVPTSKPHALRINEIPAAAVRQIVAALKD